MYVITSLLCISNTQRWSLATAWLKTIEDRWHRLLFVPPLSLLLCSFSQHTFEIKNQRASNNPNGGSRLLHFPAPLCSPNGTGLVIALLSFGGIPFFSQRHASRLNSNLNAAPSHVFEISLTGYKEPKKCVVNRISRPRGWEGNLFMISLISFFVLPTFSLVSVCPVSPPNAIHLKRLEKLSAQKNGTHNDQQLYCSTDIHTQG